MWHDFLIIFRKACFRWSIVIKSGFILTDTKIVLKIDVKTHYYKTCSPLRLSYAFKTLCAAREVVWVWQFEFSGYSITQKKYVLLQCYASAFLTHGSIYLSGNSQAYYRKVISLCNFTVIWILQDWQQEDFFCSRNYCLMKGLKEKVKKDNFRFLLST